MNDIDKVIIPQSPASRNLNNGEELGDVSLDEFNRLLPEIYSTMLHYSRITKILLTKTSPLQIGNVAFWFDVDLKTKTEQIKFNRPVTMWKRDDITAGLEVHFHNLFYDNSG